MRVCAAPRATASAVSARAHAPSSRSRAARATAAAAKCDPAARARAAASAPRCALRTRRSSALRASAAKDDLDLDLDFDVDEDDDYQGVGFGGGAGRAGAGSASRWAVEEADISISPSARAAAAAAHAASADPSNRWRDAEADDVDDPEERWDDLGDGWSEARNDRRGSFDDDDDAFGAGRGERATSPRSSGASGASPSWADEDIIADGGAAWFENDEDWYEPEYAEVNAPEGSVLEKVQRLHLREPRDFSFEDGEYFDLTGFVKDNTDNQFALVLEIAERARERRVEHLEALHPTPASAALPPIQQAIVDLALEVEASGGRTSAFSAMREAADRARLRWELQEAAWAWDNYCEDRMEALGVSERAARLLHMGQRVEDAMDFEKDLNLHEEDYNAKPPRS
jgi:hypothetical protein